MNYFIGFMLLTIIVGALAAEEELFPRRLRISRRQCRYGGKRYASGQKIETGDDCKRCFCRFGRTSCRTTRCGNAAFCQSPVKTPGECCAKCECMSEGIMYGEGENWNYRDKDADKCIQCQCMGGQAFCAPDPVNPKDCGNGMFMKRDHEADDKAAVAELLH